MERRCEEIDSVITGWSVGRQRTNLPAGQSSAIVRLGFRPRDRRANFVGRALYTADNHARCQKSTV